MGVNTAKKGDEKQVARNLEATHTMAMFWPWLGIVPAILTHLADQRYNIVDGSYYTPEESMKVNVFPGRRNVFPMRPGGGGGGGGFEFGSHAINIDGRPLVETFAGPSNIAFFTAGLCLFLLPFISGERMPAANFGMAVLLALLGAGSGAFHNYGSTMFVWQHATDRM